MTQQRPSAAWLNDPDYELNRKLLERIADLERRLQTVERQEPGKIVSTLSQAALYAPNITTNSSPSYVLTWNNSTGQIQNTALTSVTTPYARVRHTAAQTLTTSTTTAIQFNTVVEDTSGFSNLGVANTKLTVPSGLAGVYSISGNLRLASSTSTLIEIGVRLNGTTTITAELIAGASNDRTVSATTVRRLAVGDYLEITGFQNSGGNLNTVVVNEYSPCLAIAWLGA